MKKSLFVAFLTSLFMAGVAFAETSAASTSKSGFRGYLLDAHLRRPGHAHDPGAGPLLRRHGQKKECPGNDHAEFYRPGSDLDTVGLYGYSLSFGPDIGRSSEA